MEHGLCLVMISLTYYRVITLIGWARRKRGDEWELVPGARVVTRVKGAASWNGFDELAVEGPRDRYKCYPPMKKPEPLNRILVRRVKPADEKAWADFVPRPKGWKDGVS